MVMEVHIVCVCVCVRACVCARVRACVRVLVWVRETLMTSGQARLRGVTLGRTNPAWPQIPLGGMKKWLEPCHPICRHPPPLSPNVRRGGGGGRADWGCVWVAAWRPPTVCTEEFWSAMFSQVNSFNVKLRSRILKQTWLSVPATQFKLHYKLRIALQSETFQNWKRMVTSFIFLHNHTIFWFSFAWGKTRSNKY